MERARIIETMNGMIWYHRIELAPGIVTPGNDWDAMWGPMRAFHREFDFRGKRVLDVGCWDGYWSFETEKLGAAEVWATDDLSQRRAYARSRTVPFAIECLGSRVQYRPDVSVYDVEEIFGAGRFDVVIFYGVLYHLRYPALALARLRNVLTTGGTLLVETAVTLDDDRSIMKWGHREIYPTDVSTWNAPSLPCLELLLQTGYFEVERCEAFLRQSETLHIGRALVRARAVTRTEGDVHGVPDHFLGAHNPELAASRPAGAAVAAAPSESAIAHAADVDAEFEEYARAVRRSATDAISFVPLEQLRKLLFYYEQLKELQDVPGDIVEFGVFRGSTLCFLSDANWLIDGPNSARSVVGFDTFRGFPAPSGDQPWRKDAVSRDLFDHTSAALVMKKLEGRPNPRVTLVEGDITKTLPRHLLTWPNKVVMAVCDADVADVTKAILESIWDRMSPGGRIFFDEYSRDGWSETVGVDAFLKERGLLLSVVKRTRGVPFAYIQM